MKRRDFIKTAGVGSVSAGTILHAPYVIGASKDKIEWRLQTYAGSALAEHVIEPQIEDFNRAANGEMEIKLYNADQIVPHGELFRAVQDGTVDAAQSDDDSMRAPVDVSAFAAYFPFATRYGLDVAALWHWYGLKEIWEEAYAEVDNVTWLGTGAWDPCNFATKDPIKSMDDFDGKRLFMFPTVGKFMERFGVKPVSMPFEDVEVALQTGELDGVAWSGITEDYNNGWADVTNYYLTNPVSGAWAGSYFANTESWEKVPEHLKTLFRLSIDSSHYYRLHWYWWGEAHHRVKGDKLELTTIPDNEWEKVENEARKFWDEIAEESEVNAKVVKILKDYLDTMRKAGPPYRYES
ncbi:MAG: TRAP transporter substrate-binding protein [Halofilum sp. (in: g-proteobacteria)]